MIISRGIFSVCLITVLFLICSLCVVCAQPPKKNVAYFIDSIRIRTNRSLFFSAKEIKDIRVEKTNQAYPNGAIYITLKNHDKFVENYRNILTPGDIAARYIPHYNKDSQVIFIWNDKLVTDTSEFGVPPLYFDRAETIKAKKTIYGKTLPKAVVLKIYTINP